MSRRACSQHGRFGSHKTLSISEQTRSATISIYRNSLAPTQAASWLARGGRRLLGRVRGALPAHSELRKGGYTAHDLGLDDLALRLGVDRHAAAAVDKAALGGGDVGIAVGIVLNANARPRLVRGRGGRGRGKGVGGGAGGTALHLLGVTVVLLALLLVAKVRGALATRNELREGGDAAHDLGLDLALRLGADRHAAAAAGEAALGGGDVGVAIRIVLKAGARPLLPVLLLILLLVAGGAGGASVSGAGGLVREERVVAALAGVGLPAAAHHACSCHAVGLGHELAGGAGADHAAVTVSAGDAADAKAHARDELLVCLGWFVVGAGVLLLLLLLVNLVGLVLEDLILVPI